MTLAFAIVVTFITRNKHARSSVRLKHSNGGLNNLNAEIVHVEYIISLDGFIGTTLNITLYVRR